MFIVSSAQVNDYIGKFAPQILRLDKKTLCNDLPATNFGESKGLTFDRVLIFPHGLAKKWLGSGNLVHVEKSAARMYVGATRARYSLAFVFDGIASIPGIADLHTVSDTPFPSCGERADMIDKSR